MGNAIRLVRPRTVTGDGEGLVSRGGLVWLGEVADRSGLTAGLSQVLAVVGAHRASDRRNSRTQALNASGASALLM